MTAPTPSKWALERAQPIADKALSDLGGVRDAHFYAAKSRQAKRIALALDAARREGLSNDDRRFLEWIVARLVNVYGESENTDFVLKLRALAERGPGEG